MTVANPDLRYDPSSPEGGQISDLFHRIKYMEDGGRWNGADTVEVLTGWFTGLGIDVEGPAWQVDAIQPETVSPRADPDTVAGVLLAATEGKFTAMAMPSACVGFFYAEDGSDDDDDFTILTFPRASPALLRLAAAVLRRAGYDAIHTPPAYPDSPITLAVRGGLRYALPDDTPVLDRAARVLWDAGFTPADAADGVGVHYVMPTAPQPVDGAPRWIEVGVSAPPASSRHERQATAAQIAAAFTSAGWRVAETATELVHTTPPAADGTVADRSSDAADRATGPSVPTPSEPVWQPGDVVLDARHELFTRAQPDHVAQGWPWGNGADLTVADGRPCPGNGAVTEEYPARPLTLLVRNGQPAACGDPTVRRYMDLSTAHLREAAREHLNGIGGVIASRTGHGWLMWVPADSEGLDSAEARAQEYDWPPELLSIVRLARSRACDYVLFDADARTTDQLPTFDNHTP